MDLAATKAHLQALPPHVATRQTAALLTQAVHEVERLKAEKTDLGEKLHNRTVSLHQAIGMAQEGILPTPEVYNRWRATLGWHAVDIEDRERKER